MTPSGPENQQPAAQPDAAGLPVAVPESTSRDIDAMKRILPPGSMEEDGRLTIDALCRNCSYNLRGLTVTASCPTCQTPVRLALWNSSLSMSNKAWLRRVAWGINLTVVGLALLFVGFVGFFALDNLTEVWSLERSDDWFGRAMSTDQAKLLPFIVAWLPAGLVLSVGVWLATTPENTLRINAPAEPSDDYLGDIARKVLLMGSLTYWTPWLFILAMNFRDRPGSSQIWRALSLFSASCACGSPLLILIGIIFLLGYLHSLATRLPRANASSKFRVMTISFVASLAFFIALNMLGEPPNWLYQNYDDWLYGAKGPIIDASLLLVLATIFVLVVMALRLAWRMRAISKQA